MCSIRMCSNSVSRISTGCCCWCCTAALSERESGVAAASTPAGHQLTLAGRPASSIADGGRLPRQASPRPPVRPSVRCSRSPYIPGTDKYAGTGMGWLPTATAISTAQPSRAGAPMSTATAAATAAASRANCSGGAQPDHWREHNNCLAWPGLAGPVVPISLQFTTRWPRRLSCKRGATVTALVRDLMNRPATLFLTTSEAASYRILVSVCPSVRLYARMSDDSSKALK